MAINFPDSPSDNDIYTVNGKRWIYSSGKWSIYGSTAPDATASDTEPSGVGDGHIWYRSDQSQTLIRYDNTWVEVGSAGGFDNASTNFPTSLDSATGFAAVEALQAKVGVDSSAVTSSHDYILSNGVLPTLNVDSGVLVVDDTNDRVGVNDASPSYALDVTGDINATGDVRIGGTAIGEWTSFTPSWVNVTVGNATQSFFYSVLNKTVMIRGYFVFGSTTSFTGTVQMNVPYGTQVADPGIEIGGSTYNDLDTGFLYMGHNDGSGQVIRFWSRLANTNLVVRGGTQLSGTYPFTWATGDYLRVGAMYRIS